jgi:hypothetical protein
MPVPDFSPGEVLTAAAMDRIGLWLVKTDTITSGTSKEITGAFSSSFKDYLIVIDNLVFSAGVGLLLRMGTNALSYYWGGSVVQYATGVVSGEFGNNTSSFNTGAVADTSGVASTTINVFRPFETTRTGYSATGIDSRVGGGGNRTYSGFLNNTTSYTSFTLLTGGATTFTSCNVAVYGYRN